MTDPAPSSSPSERPIPPFHPNGLGPPVEAPVAIPTNGKRNRMLSIVTLLLLILAGAWLYYWFTYLRFHEYTDDAYANGFMINVNPAVAGSVVAFFTDDTSLVNQGQLLALLDSTEYEILYQKELASLAAIALQVSQLYDNIEIQQANVETKKALLSKAQYDYDNRSRLVESQAISNEDFIHSQDDLHVAEFNLKYAESQLHSARDAIQEYTPYNHPLIEEQKRKIFQAFYKLKHCAIYAPATGYVALRSVEVGQSVSPLTRLMAIIPAEGLWVDANYKETQLSNMRIGQPVDVYFDYYGSNVNFKGKVIGIASGSGSVFSLIPPQNATGNWIKIVQRLPVRISLDPELVQKYPIRLGITAEVEVDITNQDLPMLAVTPLTEPIATTKVFEISFDEAEQAIQAILSGKLVRKGAP